MAVTTNDIQTIQRALLTWFDRHKREMPWRGTSDPYAIWVSEIMLQQTQVDTVRPYFQRFMTRFPSVEALAAAPLADVLKLWEGLGYYSRARNLHRAAKQVVHDFDGEMPATVETLRSLSGIGRYTAGAIGSIAFGLDEPVLDGNVKRVLCRVFRIGTDPQKSATEKKLWTLAKRLIPAGKAGIFNQALMDLGATVCTPRNPACNACPVSTRCQAYRRGEQDVLPVRPKRKRTPHYDIAAGVVWKDGRFLISQRKPEGLLGGLWELPGGKREASESLEKCVVREIREELNVTVRVREHLIDVNHAYSHFRITLHVFLCDYVSGRPRAVGCAAWRWITIDELDDFAFPRANHKVFRAFREVVSEQR